MPPLPPRPLPLPATTVARPARLLAAAGRGWLYKWALVAPPPAASQTAATVSAAWHTAARHHEVATMQSDTLRKDSGPGTHRFAPFRTCSENRSHSTCPSRRTIDGSFTIHRTGEILYINTGQQGQATPRRVDLQSVCSSLCALPATPAVYLRGFVAAVVPLWQMLLLLAVTALNAAADAAPVFDHCSGTKFSSASRLIVNVGPAATSAL